MRPRSLTLAVAAALAVATAACDETGDKPPGAAPLSADTPSTPPSRLSSTAPASTTPAPPRTITIGWAGDAVPASSDIGLPADPGVLFGRVAPILREPDLMIGNLEGTLTTRGTSKCGASSSNCFAFRSPPAYARLFAEAGFDLINLANNHSHDFGEVGLADTQAALRSAGLPFTGMPGQVTTRRVQGTAVAVLGFAPYGWAAPLNDPAEVRRLVASARARARVVVVVFHGGAEGADAVHVPAGREFGFGEDRGDLRAFARVAIDAGASAVLGSGPHVVRGMEFYRGRLIAYSVGNFVGYRTLSGDGTTGITAVVRLTLTTDGGYVGGSIAPTEMVRPGYAAPDAERRAIALMRQLSRADFGRSAARIGADGRISPPTG